MVSNCSFLPSTSDCALVRLAVCGRKLTAGGGVASLVAFLGVFASTAVVAAGSLVAFPAFSLDQDCESSSPHLRLSFRHSVLSFSSQQCSIVSPPCPSPLALPHHHTPHWHSRVARVLTILLFPHPPNPQFPLRRRCPSDVNRTPKWGSLVGICGADHARSVCGLHIGSSRARVEAMDGSAGWRLAGIRSGEGRKERVVHIGIVDKRWN